MLKKYKDEVSRIPEGIRMLQTKENLFLYGNSVYALDILRKLEKYKININGILVSKGYAHDDLWEGYPVYEAEKFLDKCRSSISIIAGFQVLVHTDLVDSLCANCNINRLYVLDGCSYLFCNQFHFPKSKICLIDNYYEGLIRRDLSQSYYEENYKLFLQTYNWLEDDKSRKTMEEYLRGHIELAAWPMLNVWKEDDVENQYFPEDIIQLSDDEVFVDCGAYTGDTLESFIKRVNKFAKYYALEPDKRRFQELHSKITSKNILHIPYGAWNERDRLYFSTEYACGEIANASKIGEYIEVDAVDNLILKEDKVSFIKMDIEGAELNALCGAEKIILRDKPKLAICVYHKREDLITIPQYIKSIVPEYKFYLRAHFPYASEVVLYGICK